MTLVELIVYCAVGVLAMACLAALASRAFSAHSLAIAQDQANVQVQLAATNLQTTLRNTCLATVDAHGNLSTRTFIDGGWQTRDWTMTSVTVADALPNGAVPSATFAPVGQTMGFGSSIHYALAIDAGGAHASAVGELQVQGYSNTEGAGC